MSQPGDHVNLCSDSCKLLLRHFTCTTRQNLRPCWNGCLGWGQGRGRKQAGRGVGVGFIRGQEGGRRWARARDGCIGINQALKERKGGEGGGWVGAGGGKWHTKSTAKLLMLARRIEEHTTKQKCIPAQVELGMCRPSLVFQIHLMYKVKRSKKRVGLMINSWAMTVTCSST